MEKRKRISVYIAQDYPLIRKALFHIIEKSSDFKIQGLFETTEDLIQEFSYNNKNLNSKKESKIIIMNISRNKNKILASVKQIKEKFDNVKILLLTSCPNDEESDIAFNTGANAYCSEEIDTDTLLSTIKQLSLRDEQICPKNPASAKS